MNGFHWNGVVNFGMVNSTGTPVFRYNGLSDEHFSVHGGGKADVEWTFQWNAGVKFPNGGSHFLHFHVFSAGRLDLDACKVSVTVCKLNGERHVVRVCSGVDVDRYFTLRVFATCAA